MSTSLDDLLNSAGEEPEPAQPTGRTSSRTVWWLVRATLWSVGLAFPIWGFFRIAGLDLPFVLLAMVLFVGQVLRSLLRWVDARPLPRTLIRPSAELVSADRTDVVDRDGLAIATRRWDTRLSFARLQRDPGQFARTVQPRLIEIIDERLRLRHGLVRSADPARARAVLGEPLWTFVTTPVRTNPTPRDLAGLITLMEAL